MPVTFDKVREIALAFPGAEEGTSWGMPTFRVRKKIFVRLIEDGESLAVKCGDRDEWISFDPKIFHVTRHYLNYAMVLVRFAKAKPAILQDIIEQAWRIDAGAKLIKLYDSGTYVAPPLPPSPLTAPKAKSEDKIYAERARRICKALPEVEEKAAWSAPTFRVKGKMFAMYLNNHHGDGRIALWLKAPTGVQEMLVEAAPEKFFIPPYQGPFGWIGIHLDRTDDDEIAAHVMQAWRMVAPKKLQDLPDKK